MSRGSLALRVAGGSAVALVFFLEGGCASATRAPSGAGAGASPSSPSKQIPSSILSAYEAARIKAWDPERRFKALFRAEVSPKVGAIGRGYLSVWWDGPTGALAWRTSAPIAGAGRGGVLRKGKGEGGGMPLSARLSAPDLIACLLGTPNAAPSSSIDLDAEGRVVAMRFPGGDVVKLQPGEGVPRRIEANGPDGRAILTLESYVPWPKSEEIPPL